MASETGTQPACAPWSKGSSESVLSRRRKSGRSWGTIPTVLTCLVSLTSAATITSPPLPSETLCIDPRTPVLEDGQWTYVMAQEKKVELRRRDNSTENSSSTSTTSITRPTDTPPLSTLPSPFDGSLISNWTTETCRPFFEYFLKDPTFQQCYPFSMIMQVCGPKLVQKRGRHKARMRGRACQVTNSKTMSSPPKPSSTHRSQWSQRHRSSTPPVP